MAPHDGVTVKRSTLADIARRLGAAPKHVVVGVLGSKASEPHKGDAGATLGQVVSWNYFGTSTIPARPFIAIAFEKYGAEIRAIQKQIAAGVISGKLDVDRGLELLGLEAVARVKQTIIEHVPPPNAPRTVELKGSSTPLVNTGQLIGGITHAVREGR